MLHRNFALLFLPLLAFTTPPVVAASPPAGTAAKTSLSKTPASKAPVSKTPSLDELKHRLAVAQKRATAARVLADRQEAAASSAEASLRQAELALTALQGQGSAAAPLAAIATQQDAMRIASAQADLRLAQQQEQMAELQANTMAPPGFVPSSPSAPAQVPALPPINQASQLQLQSARDAVSRAQAALAEAQRQQASGGQPSAVGTTINALQLRNAELAVVTARKLAMAAHKAADKGNADAQQLAEEVDRAQEAVAAAK